MVDNQDGNLTCICSLILFQHLYSRFLSSAASRDVFDFSMLVLYFDSTNLGIVTRLRLERVTAILVPRSSYLLPSTLSSSWICKGYILYVAPGF